MFVNDIEGIPVDILHFRAHETQMEWSSGHQWFTTLWVEKVLCYMERKWKSVGTPEGSLIALKFQVQPPYFWWCPTSWTFSQCCNCHATMGNWKRCSSTWKSACTQGVSMIAAKFQGLPPYSWHRPIHWTHNQCCNCDATMENWKIHSRTWKTAVTRPWSTLDLKFQGLPP